MSLLLLVDLISLENHLDGKGLRIMPPVLPIILDGFLAMWIIVLGFWTTDSIKYGFDRSKETTA